MLRHERQTVAMELAAALHHSRDVGPGTHVGLRAQKTASSAGARPAALKVAEPGAVVFAAWCSQAEGAPGPLRFPRLALPQLAAPANEVVDTAAVRFLLAQNLKKRQEEEALAKKEEEELEEELCSLLNMPSERRTAEQRSRLSDLLQRRSDAILSKLPRSLCVYFSEEKEKEEKEEAPEGRVPTLSSRLWTSL